MADKLQGGHGAGGRECRKLPGVELAEGFSAQGWFLHFVHTAPALPSSSTEPPGASELEEGFCLCAPFKRHCSRDFPPSWVIGPGSF